MILRYFIGLLFGLNLFLTTFAYGSTNVGGVIFTDTTWTSSGSPYIMGENVLVPQGVTLKVDPGVQIEAADNTFPYLQVEGKLVARGISSNSINIGCRIFFADSSTDASFDVNNNYLDGCILEYCTLNSIRDSSVYLLGQRAGILIDNSSPFINHCTIQNLGSGAIVIDNGSPLISNNLISNNWSNNYISVQGNPRGAGIYSIGTDSRVVIEGNTIIGNESLGSEGAGQGGGIFIEGGEVVIRNNLITSNHSNEGGGIYISRVNGTILTVEENKISENTAEFGPGCGCGAGLYLETYPDSSIRNNIILKNSAEREGAGMCFGGGASVTSVENNIIVENSGGDGTGIYYWGGTSSINNNSILRNEGLTTIYFENSEQGNFSYNTVVGNSGGDTIYIKGFPLFNRNNIANEANYYELDNLNEAGTTLYVENCWWGIVDSTEISNRIRDWGENNSLGIVDFYPFLATPDIQAPVIPPDDLIASISDQKINLSWNPNQESDLAGYKVYYDTDSGEPYNGTGATQGNSPVDVGNANSFTLSGLISGNYYIAITAYDINGNESWYSKEVSVQLCTYIISPTNQSFDANGGASSVIVSAPTGCSWSATSNASWISIISGDSGTGNDTVYYLVLANTNTSSRTGTMTIAGETFSVTQEGRFECSTWTDVIDKYNAYVGGQTGWTDVITCYSQYTSQGI